MPVPTKRRGTYPVHGHPTCTVQIRSTMTRQYCEVNTIQVCDCRRFILLHNIIHVLSFGDIRSRVETILIAVDRVKGRDLEIHFE